MRLLLMFDMPTYTPQDKRDYRQFRRFLITEGFIMHQFSIYTKLLLNETATSAMIKRLEKNTPRKGDVSVLKITEKQFAKMIYLHGKRNKSIANSDSRLIFLGSEKHD